MHASPGAGQPGVVLAAFGSMMNVEPHALIALAKMFALLPQVGCVICHTQMSFVGCILRPSVRDAVLVLQRVVWKVSDRDLSNDTRRTFDAVVAAAGEPSCCRPARQCLLPMIGTSHRTCIRLPWSYITT